MLSARGGSGERGFTLVEATVALVISSLVMSALVGLLIGQSRFYDRLDDQINAEQLAEATYELVSGEVRMARGSDLLVAETDSVSFRFDVLQAIVCDSTGPDAAALYTFLRSTAAGLSGSFVGLAVAELGSPKIVYVDGWDPTPVATGLAPKAVCTAAGAPPTGAASDYAILDGWKANLGGDVPGRGDLVRGYQRLSFRMAPSTFFAPNWSLWRGTQELAGPFEPNAAFAYLMDDGSELSSVIAPEFDRVVAVRLVATAVGEGSNPYSVRRSIDFLVPFRP